MHIPFPEQLDDDTWAEKWQQLQWLADQGIIGLKGLNEDGEPN